MPDRSELRGRLFRHLDGMAVLPVVVALRKRGVLDHLLEQGSANLRDLAHRFGANDGYLNVALRALASQGFLDYAVDNSTDQVWVRLNECSETAFALFALYDEVASFWDKVDTLPADFLDPAILAILETLFDRHVEGWSDAPHQPRAAALHRQLQHHLEGNLVAPLLVQLARAGLLAADAAGRLPALDGHADAVRIRKALGLFARLGWVSVTDERHCLTAAGQFFADKASAYGVIVSYLPTFRTLPAAIFGDTQASRNASFGESEWHVDREMNIWGSGGAHATYFRIVDRIIVDLFDRPIERQPLGILDMGCGNGAFLAHLYRLIETQTLRGRLLQEHPLRLIGADYNKASLEVTQRNLREWNIPAEVIWGDIGRPDLLACDLRNTCGLELGELLNVRTFLDHNRVWEPPPAPRENRASTSTGAFALRGGRIGNNQIEENLLMHLKRWAPYVRRFGLLMIELHTIDPVKAAANIGRSVATAYDVAHGFSDQYIVELDVLHRVAAEAGLFSDETAFRCFPDSAIPTVSVNLFCERRRNTIPDHRPDRRVAPGSPA